MEVIQDVQFFSQKEDSVVSAYGRKGCGLIALRIAVSCFVGDIEFSVLHTVAKKTGAYTEKDGWLHDGLIAIANYFNLYGQRKECEKNKLKFFLQKGNPVIASMKKEYANTLFSHLIVLIGYTENCFIVHDPWDFGPNHKISFEDFEKYWTGRVIIISKAPLIL